MTMQTVINIFTIGGSILGIAAFLLTIFSSIHDYNIKKWEKLSSIVNFNDFEEFVSGVSIGIIYSRPSNKFNDFIRLIRNEREEIQFKGFAKKKIDKIFSEILLEHEKFISEVQAPRWEVWAKNRESIERKINKDFFDDKFHTIQEHSRNINKSIKTAIDTIETIIKLYKKIHSVSNKLPHEILLKRQ